MNKTAKTIINRLIKENEKIGRYIFAYMTKDNHYWFTDRYIALRVPESLGYSIEEQDMFTPFVDKILEDPCRHEMRVIPPVTALREMKKEGARHFDFGFNKPMFQIKYLIDAIQAVGSNPVMIYTDKPYFPVLFKGDEEDTLVVLCPCKKGDTK